MTALLRSMWVCRTHTAIGRNNWLFAGSLRAGKRAAAVMSLIRSAKLNGKRPAIPS